MAHTVIMPRQGQSVESCILGKWHKNKGEPVAAGDLLFTYETDKSTFDEYSKEAGTLLEIFFIEGDDVPCLANVCAIGSPGEDVSGFANQPEPPGETEKFPAAAKTEAVPKNETETETVPAYKNAGPLKISPRARNFAERAGIDPEIALPTGPYGRVITRDIETLLLNPDAAVQKSKSEPKPEPSGGFEYVKHTGIRKAIARSMSASLQNMAQLTLNSSFDASEIMGVRAKIKENGDRNFPNITVGDMILFAVSRVLPRHRFINAHCDENGVKLFNSVNLGVAVDTERGLMVPTLFGAEKMSLAQISGNVKKLAALCREGKINPDALTGGTFTVTNLGALGVESFTPVINPPQTAILGVCSAVERPVVRNGALTAYPAIGLSLTFDHRAVDGAPAARFLADLVNFLENFTVSLALGA